MFKALFKIILPILVLVGGVMGFNVLKASRPVLEPAEVGERVFTIETVPIEIADNQPSLQIYGELQAARSIDLRTNVAGEVISTGTAFVEGGRVKAGDVLLSIDPFDYRTAVEDIRAQIAETDAKRVELEVQLDSEKRLLGISDNQVTLRQSEVNRFVNLRNRGTISESAVDASRLALNSAFTEQASRAQAIARIEAQIKQIEATLQRQNVELERRQRDFEDTALVAPFDGILGAINANIGKKLSTSETVASLIDDSSFEMHASIPDADFGRLWADGLIDREVLAVWRLGTRDFPLKGRVSRVESAINSETGGINIIAEMTENLGNAPLRSGAFLTMSLPDTNYQDSIRLPATALFDDGVYMIREERLLRVDVDVVARPGDYVIIRSDGLSEGDLVANTRLAEMSDGLKVEALP